MKSTFKTNIDKKAILDTDLPATSFRVYCFMKLIGDLPENRGVFKISVRNIAKQVGKTWRTVFKAIQDLEKAGYILINREEGEEHIYTIL